MQGYLWNKEQIQEKNADPVVLDLFMKADNQYVTADTPPSNV